MICDEPGCTGVHRTNRYRELCPRSKRSMMANGRRYYNKLSAEGGVRYLLRRAKVSRANSLRLERTKSNEG